MNKSKSFLTISIITLIITVVASAVTYAWFSWSTTSDNETRIVTNMGAAKVYFNSGANITSAKLRPTIEKEDGIVKNITVKTSKDTAYKISFNLYLDVISIDDGLKDTTFKYALYKVGTADAVAEGNFSQNSLNSNLVTCMTNNTSHIVLVSDEAITTTKQEYKLYIWIDGTVDNPETMENQKFSFKLHADGQNAVLGNQSGDNSSGTFVEYLTNKYMSASPAKATTANNGINYYYAPSVGMMNDGMGSNHTWEDGANTGNIRYYGATPSNYIDIGDRDASGNVIPWRIIGVFKNMTLADGSTDTLVKVIKNEPLDEDDMQLDDSSNDWHNATLQTYLNTGDYYTGLSQNVKDKIAKVEWNLGGWNDSGVYPNVIYEEERGSSKCSSCTYETIWEGDIALMYPSDYGYGADLSSCNKTLYDYDNSTCTGTNWMYNSVTSNGNKPSWLLTPGSSRDNRAWDVDLGGRVYADDDVSYEIGVSPALYLKSDLILDSGGGTSVSDAYVVR